MRILIVEDEVRLAETLRDLLELEHYTADISHDGESGLDNALSDIYDLVILDVMLPKKDGFSVLRELRQADESLAYAQTLCTQAQQEGFDAVQKAYGPPLTQERGALANVMALFDALRWDEALAALDGWW